MANTKEIKINYKDGNELLSVPVASGQTIYSGNYAAICEDGYLYNLATTNVAKVRIIGKVYDKTANTSGPAATTAAGSIAGEGEKASGVSGDNTVVKIYTKGRFVEAFSSIGQSDVGKTVYMTDNYTFSVSAAAGVKVGTLVKYLSSTLGEIELNLFANKDGSFYYKAAITATTATTGGGAFSILNPYAEDMYVTRAWIDITTGSTGSAVIDIGIASSGATSAENLLDGQATSTATILDNTVSGGTAGKGVVKWTSGYYLTGTASASLAGMVATINVIAMSAE